MKTGASSSSQGGVSPDDAYGSSPVALCVIDRQMRCLSANQHLATLLKCPLDELVGHHVGTRLPDAIVLLEQGFRKADSGQSFSNRHLLEIPNSGRTYRVKASPLFDPDGGLVGLSCAMVDVTEEQTAIKALQDMENLCNFALQNAGQWIWEYNVGTGAVWRSAHWKAALGYEADDTVEGDENVAWGIVHPDDRRQVEMRFNRLLDGHTDQFDATYRIRHKNGR